MARKKNKRHTRRSKTHACNNQVESEQHLEEPTELEEPMELEEPTDLEEQTRLKDTQPVSTSAADGLLDDEPEGEIELSEDDAHLNEPKRKRQRGPTTMKNIAKDPNIRERVNFTVTGEPCGPGSVKLSSYLGPLVREHVPVTLEGWKKLSEEVKTVLWRSIQARFELDQPYQKKVVFKQMRCLWRSSKSRLVSKVIEAKNNQQRMNLRPTNVSPIDWRKFVKVKTSPSFRVLSDSFKQRRAKQIPDTCSRKGMVRLTEEMKQNSSDPSEVNRLKVWVKSRTRKDGTPVNTNAAENFLKAAELVDRGAPLTETNPGDDILNQLLGPDNPGRLRAMGRGMSKTKLECFQVKQKCIEDMEANQVRLIQKVSELQDEIVKMKNQEREVGENSAVRSVNKRLEPKCVLIDWDGTEDHVVEGRIIPSSPEDLVNGTRLGPIDVKVCIDSVIKPEAFLWRPATYMYKVKEAVGEIIAWSANHYTVIDKMLQPEDLDLQVKSLDKCKLLDLGADDVIVVEGLWQTDEAEALVNGIPLGPNAAKVFVDAILQPQTFIWRPTKDITYLADCFKSFVSWPARKVVLETTTVASGHKSTVQKSIASEQASGRKSPIEISQRTGPTAAAKDTPSPIEKSPAGTNSKYHTEKSHASKDPTSPKKKIQATAVSPIRKSQRKNPNTMVVKENQMCRLMDVANGKRVVDEGLWISNNPDQNVHFVRLGDNAVKVLVKLVNVPDAAVWRPSSAIECMEDALGTYIAWPENKVCMV